MKQHPRELSNFLFSHLSSQFSEEKLNSSDTRLPFSSWLGNRSSSSRRVQMSLTLASWARCVDADGIQGTPENVHLIKWRKVNSNDIHLKPSSSSRLDSVQQSRQVQTSLNSANWARCDVCIQLAAVAVSAVWQNHFFRPRSTLSSLCLTILGWHSHLTPPQEIKDGLAIRGLLPGRVPWESEQHPSAPKNTI